jgi:2-hydroxy-3-keto-5-methylthiopentenyl-1-phosphate phosphatase
MKNALMAIMYDFDKTLSLDYMQNYGFIQDLGLTPGEFWDETNKFSDKVGADKTLAYMYMMLIKCKEKGIPLTREWLMKYGANIKFFKGVSTWFKRINDYGLTKNVQVEHYLISSGNKEIVDGSLIAKEFTKIFGCEFVFDEKTHEAVWPKLCVNYTQKTQYFFRIAKGALNPSDEVQVNEKTPIHRIPYQNMVYMGDGMTDIPAMILAHNNGGASIALYSETAKKENVAQLLKDDRVNYVCRADYSAGSELDTVMKLIVDSISIRNTLERKQEAVVNK